MKLWMFRTALLLLFALPTCAIAGLCTSDPLPNDSRHEFQFFAGYSPASATLIGTTTGRRFVAAGFDYSYRCWAGRHVSTSFTAGVTPAAILLQPAMVTEGQFFLHTEPPHAVYGFGVTPVGVTVDFARNKSVYPFFQFDGGIVASTERIPVNVTDATALNFLFDFGGGVKWRPHEGRVGFELGYRFLHISNAFTTPVNPGVDNNVFYAGVLLFR
jgi:hypothetical protein